MCRSADCISCYYSPQCINFFTQHAAAAAVLTTVGRLCHSHSVPDAYFTRHSIPTLCAPTTVSLSFAASSSLSVLLPQTHVCPHTSYSLKTHICPAHHCAPRLCSQLLWVSAAPLATVSQPHMCPLTAVSTKTQLCPTHNGVPQLCSQLLWVGAAVQAAQVLGLSAARHAHHSLALAHSVHGPAL